MPKNQERREKFLGSAWHKNVRWLHELVDPGGYSAYKFIESLKDMGK